MIIYTPENNGGAALKSVKFTVPTSFWVTANSNPITILGASKNHYHIPLSLTYYYPGGAIQVYSGGAFVASKEMYNIGTRFMRITDPFQAIAGSGGIAGIYQMTNIDNLAAYCYVNPIDDPLNDLYFFGGLDDPAADMVNVKFELIYYTYKP